MEVIFILSTFILEDNCWWALYPVIFLGSVFFPLNLWHSIPLSPPNQMLRPAQFCSLLVKDVPESENWGTSLFLLRFNSFSSIYLDVQHSVPNFPELIFFLLWKQNIKFAILPIF